MKRSALLPLAAFVGAFALCTAAPLQAQNIVNDPGFEDSTDNTIGGNPFSSAWTLNELNGFSVVGGRALFAHSGNNYAALAPDINQFGSLSQALNTAPGALYTLSFWLASDRTFAPDNAFQVFWNGTSIFSVTNLPPSPPTANAGQYINYSFTNLVANGSGPTTLEFRYNNDDDVFRLDDVSVAVVPEPSAVAFALLGLGLLGGWQFRKTKRA